MRRLALLALFVCCQPVGAVTAAFCVQLNAVENPTNPILFVTQVPIAQDFATIGSTFANHMARIDRVGRGGDLYIRYPDGQLCNVTRAGGYGQDGSQDSTGIAVRDPAVHFSADKAVFSMVVGAPEQQYQWGEFYWQLYEVTGLQQGQPVTITKVAQQPADYNNVGPVYSSDGSIVFTSDRPRNGQRHLYPQLDEYESTPTTTGLWKLDPQTGKLQLLQHAPSGSFDPILDRYGRIIFTRWDHLQRDQQNDAGTYGTFDWEDETANAAVQAPLEVFPEPRIADGGSNVNGFTINHFFPWMIHQDGSGEETLNHIGRHELHNYFNRSFNNDNNLFEFIASVSGRNNPHDILNFFQIVEDPNTPGRYLGVEAPEFGSHAAGQLIALNGAPSVNPEDMLVGFITHEDTRDVTDNPSANHTGLYRNPLPMSDGSLWAVHAPQTHYAGGSAPLHHFRVKRMIAHTAGLQQAGGSLTGGIIKNISYWDPDQRVTYNGPMWEFSPVEVRVRPVPPTTQEPPLATPEQDIFTAQSIYPPSLQAYLAERDLALMVVRNSTRRDDIDAQQPFNLQVPDGVSSVVPGGPSYSIDRMQFVQGDQVRGIYDDTEGGRRVLARFLHDTNALSNNPPWSQNDASTPIYPDGSMAMAVPAQRAMSWQAIAPDDTPIVRERYWITFKPGEIRVCDGCHGVNDVSHTGEGAAQNPPLALTAWLQWWKSEHDVIFANGF